MFVQSVPSKVNFPSNPLLNSVNEPVSPDSDELIPEGPNEVSGERQHLDAPAVSLSLLAARLIRVSVRTQQHNSVVLIKSNFRESSLSSRGGNGNAAICELTSDAAQIHPHARLAPDEQIRYVRNQQ